MIFLVALGFASATVKDRRHARSLRSLGSVAEMQAFYEVLLSYGASNMVYTSLIDANQIGFDENAYDFEMLVGEDWNDEAVTPYYFFAEIS